MGARVVQIGNKSSTQNGACLYIISGCIDWDNNSIVCDIVLGHNNICNDYIAFMKMKFDRT